MTLKLVRTIGLIMILIRVSLNLASGRFDNRVKKEKSRTRTGSRSIMQSWKARTQQPKARVVALKKAYPKQAYDGCHQDSESEEN